MLKDLMGLIQHKNQTIAENAPVPLFSWRSLLKRPYKWNQQRKSVIRGDPFNYCNTQAHAESTPPGDHTPRRPHPQETTPLGVGEPREGRTSVENVAKSEPSGGAAGNVRCGCCGNSCSSRRAQLPWDPAVLLLGVRPEKCSAT